MNLLRSAIQLMNKLVKEVVATLKSRTDALKKKVKTKTAR